MKTAAWCVLAALIGAGLVWQFVADRATAAERDRWQAKLAVERDSTAAWRTRAVQTTAVLTRLRADSARLYPQLATAREAISAALGTIRALARDTATRDTAAVGAALESAVVAIETADRACTVTLQSCEARAAAEHARAEDATTRAEALLTIQDTTVRKLQAAERAASPGFLGWRDAWRAKEQLGLVVALLVLLLK